jgi:dipeptidyl aminopeptidase/acylaminoacyl peptidase
MKRLCSLLFVLAVTLAACGTQPTPTRQAAATTSTVGLVPTKQDPAVLPTATAVVTEPPTLTPEPTSTPTATPLPLNPLQIEYLRQRDYPGSDVTIEQTLTPGANYSRYIASYRSDGLKIYALLTVPNGPKPKTGWPVIIFNHGYIPPAIYRTTERYVAYVDAIARAGYIVFKSDYRGHGSSEGDATGGYGSSDYTIDVLNALASMKRYPDADPNRIGMWGHSMGGQVTLRAMVTSKDVKAGVIWSGVVGSYLNLMNNWHHTTTGEYVPTTRDRHWRQDLLQTYGSPQENPQFWASISPNTYVSDLSGPLQLHHDVADGEVPFQFSQELYDEVKQAGGTAELFSYPGDDHNIAQSFSLAMQRTIAFFDKYVKPQPRASS